MVKSAFGDSWWHKQCHLSSANSINIGRLLPQIAFYAYASFIFFHQYGIMPGFIIPTGNLGNAIAAYWAKQIGFPIREIVVATNANRVITDYLTSGKFIPRLSIQTLANAMDVGNPSNYERLQNLFNTLEEMRKNVTAISMTDEQIKTTIAEFYTKYRAMICPHTATACYARTLLSEKPWIAAATADPSKFESVLAPIIHQTIPIPRQLQILLAKPTHEIVISPQLSEIKKYYNDTMSSASGA